MDSLLQDIALTLDALRTPARVLAWTVGVLLLAGGLEDLVVDLAYWFHWIARRDRSAEKSPLPDEEFRASPEQAIAVFVPAWREEAVIEQMLTRACRTIEYERYDVFVGVYPNDPRTLEKVRRAAERFPRIHIVLGGHAGPSTKAANLNEIFEGMLAYENRTGERYELIVLHDAEDVVHPQSLRAFNLLVPRYDMVQFPVFPLPAPAGQHVHWVSADEFAELHTRELPARQALNGFVPSAGVGTAFNRWVLQFAGTSYARNLFSRRSLTEDYDLALRLALGGAKLAFLERPFGRAIATRALFPRSFAAAVRQRTRWLIGICLQSWGMHGWHGGAWFRFMLFRDRKAIADNLLAGVSYILLIYLLSRELAAVGVHHAALHQPVVASGTALWYLVIADTLLMLWRGLQRAVCVRRVYGSTAAALSIPRLVLATVINCCAAIRAIGQAVSFGLAERRIPWEKTSHEYPQADHLRVG